jgi:hypothetical protein
LRGQTVWPYKSLKLELISCIGLVAEFCKHPLELLDLIMHVLELLHLIDIYGQLIKYCFPRILSDGFCLTAVRFIALNFADLLIDNLCLSRIRLDGPSRCGHGAGLA